MVLQAPLGLWCDLWGPWRCLILLGENIIKGKSSPHDLEEGRLASLYVNKKWLNQLLQSLQVCRHLYVDNYLQNLIGLIQSLAWSLDVPKIFLAHVPEMHLIWLSQSQVIRKLSNVSWKFGHDWPSIGTSSIYYWLRHPLYIWSRVKKHLLVNHGTLSRIYSSLLCA